MPASKKEAKEFVKRWQKRLAAIPAGSNNEQQDTQKFWVDLLINVLGIPSNTIDNFVWPEPTESQREEVERCAQAVLDARDAQEGATLADMYDPKNETFFPELMAAHKALDTAVEAAYGVDFGGDEEKIVAHLFNLYAERVGV